MLEDETHDLEDQELDELEIINELSIEPHIEFERSPKRFHENLARKWAAYPTQTLARCMDVLEMSQAPYVETENATEKERRDGRRYTTALNSAIQSGLMTWPGVAKLYQLCRSENQEWSKKWLEHWAARVSLNCEMELDDVLSMPMSEVSKNFSKEFRAPDTFGERGRKPDPDAWVIVPQIDIKFDRSTIKRHIDEYRYSYIRRTEQKGVFEIKQGHLHMYLKTDKLERYSVR